MIVTGASGASRTKSTIFIGPLSVMDGTAGRQITNDVNCMNCGSGAGQNTISGGMNTNIAGTVIVIGTITITIVTRRRRNPWDYLAAAIAGDAMT